MKPSVRGRRPQVSEEEFVHQMLRPEVYPVETSSVHMIETHISRVFLTDRRVYKTKKGVRFDFLDYGTLDQRCHACHEEIRLNRRLAPGVYLGVLPIVMTEEGLRVGAAGQAVEFCVEMRRLPEQRFLSSLIGQHSVASFDIDRLLDLLVRFYLGQGPRSHLTRYASAAAIEAAVRGNLDVLSGPTALLARSEILRLRSSQCQFVCLHRDLFARRIAAGWIREGHGDLRPQHICLVHRPIVFDCVEFSESVRSADVLSELAFLAMECDYLGNESLGNLILAGYRHRSDDDFPPMLAAFYKALRASIRGKVELLRAAQESGRDAEEARMRAHRYVQLASSYAAEFHQPLLLVMVGTAGSGKSTLAQVAAARLGAQIVRTDVVRHELARQRAQDAAWGQGIYTESMTQRTYQVLLERARGLLADSVSVVLDGTFLRAELRAAARRTAAECGATVRFVRCDCPIELAAARIGHRLAAGDDVSDARPEVSVAQQEQLAQQTDLDPESSIPLQMAHPVEVLAEQLLGALQRSRGSRP